MDRARPMPHVRPGARGRALSLKSGYAEWVQIHIFIPPLGRPTPLGKNAVGAGCPAARGRAADVYAATWRVLLRTWLRNHLSQTLLLWEIVARSWYSPVLKR